MLLTATRKGWVLTAQRLREGRDYSSVSLITGMDRHGGFTRCYLDKRTDEVGLNRFSYLREESIYHFADIPWSEQSEYSYVRHGGACGYFRIVGGRIHELDEGQVERMISQEVTG